MEDALRVQQAHLETVEDQIEKIDEEIEDLENILDELKPVETKVEYKNRDI